MLFHQDRFFGGSTQDYPFRNFLGPNATFGGTGRAPVKRDPKYDTPQRKKHGLMGLLKIINTGNFQNDSSIQKLALGFDLTTLGLNLNSTEFLHTGFSSPHLAERKYTVKNSFSLPECYTNFPEKMTHDKVVMEKYLDETLFYIFYSHPGDQLQIDACVELSKRKWVYHKKNQKFYKALKIAKKEKAYERGNFYIFDVEKWEKCIQNDFTFEYKERLYVK